MKAPKSGFERLELVLDVGLDKLNETDEDREPESNTLTDACDREEYLSSSHPGEILRCSSSHSASTAETDNRSSYKLGGFARTWSLESDTV